MAWRDPFFCAEHKLAAASATVTADSVAATGFPVTRVHDRRHGANFKHLTSQANNAVEVDLAGGGFSFPTRVLIPVGHNLSGEQLIVEDDDNAGFTSARELLDVTPTVNLLNESLGSVALQRYVRFRVVGVAVPEYPEIWLTVDLPIVRGPAPKWRGNTPIAERPNITVLETRAGETFRDQRGPSRKVFDLEWRHLAAVDVNQFLNLQAFTAFGLHPFWYFDQNDANDPVPVELVNPLEDSIVQERDNPQAGERYRVRMNMLEVLG